MRRAVWSLVAVLVSLAVGGAFGSAGAAILDEDYEPYDARITDTKGVVVECERFGYATGPNILMAHLGEGMVDVPMRKVRMLEFGVLDERTRRTPCRATMLSGKVYALEMDNSEMMRLMWGESEIGEYRIRLEKIRRLEIVRAEPAPRQ